MGTTRLLFLGLCGLSLITYVTCQQTPTTPDRTETHKYPYVTDLEPDNYVLRWGFNSSLIWFEVQAHTLGYVAFGIAEAERMYPADVVVGYISGGNITFVDYHNTGYAHPVLDTSQDWVLDYGFEENGWTVLGFYRRLDTCDTVGDRVITRDTQHIIYSYHNDDPPSYRSLMYHQNRGVKSVNLLTMSPPPSQFITGVETVEFRNNFTIPLEDTSLHCRLFTIAGTPIAQRKNHIIKIEPIFHTATYFNLKKVTLYRCSFPDMSQLQGGQNFDCFRDNAVNIQHCKEYVASFIPGSEDFYLPEDLGLPFGGPNRADLYVLATEYDNQNLETGLVDSSGVRLLYTPTLRTHDAAFLTIASPISNAWYQFIPPYEDSFTQKAYCSEECLRWGFNTPGVSQITIAGAQFQARQLGSAMRLRHLVPSTTQQGVHEERPWIIDNRKYTHDTQSVQIAETSHRISVGDTLLLECTYDTTSLNNYTVGGWLNSMELCRAHVLYYPPIQLEGCFSWSLYDTLRDSSNARIPSQSVFPTLKSVDWSNAGMRQVLKEVLGSSMHNAQCWSSNQSPTYMVHNFTQPMVPTPFQQQTTTNCPGA